MRCVGFEVLGGFLRGSVMFVPLSATAADHDRRYYDRDGHDYHQWNDHEDRAYRVYLGEQHREYREFNRVKSIHQREYFRQSVGYSGHPGPAFTTAGRTPGGNEELCRRCRPLKNV